MYLGPVHARGGGVYGVPLNGKDIDVFPAVAVGKEETTIDVPTLLGLAKEKPSRTTKTLNALLSSSLQRERKREKVFLQRELTLMGMKR